MRYMLRGKAREMGLGSLSLISLAEARTKAVDARRLCREGIDPIDRRKAQRAAQALDEAKSKTFAECFEAWMKAHSHSWVKKYESVQRGQIAPYVNPILGL
jgi:hypothetical protein